MIHHCVDAVFLGRITGWAFAPRSGATTDAAGPLVIEAWHHNTCLGRTIADRPRGDVGEAYPAHPHSALSGFDLEFRLPDDAGESTEIAFRASLLDRNGTSSAQPLSNLRVLTRRTYESALAPTGGSMTIAAAPFPRPLVEAAQQLWPNDRVDLHHEDAQHELVDRIVFMARGPESAQLPSLLQYVRFLRATWAHFQFVSRYFPTFNLAVPLDSKDASSKQNTPDEMLSIAHHLYVLRSFGVTGDFAEFGCFKGFSSSMLSFACDRLGIRMHIFDSFEGLPPSDSHYYRTGEFRGGLDEVQRNVEALGVSRAVTYHKGFFSDSLPVANLPPLMSLWMDVDLASSATDVMTIADRIDPRGAVFSHECEAGNFVNGGITAHPDSVIPSIVQSYTRLGASISGRFLAGNTGAFWRQNGGFPVLSHAVLMKLMQAI